MFSTTSNQENVNLDIIFQYSGLEKLKSLTVSNTGEELGKKLPF